MEWSTLKWWIFRRGVISGPILGVVFGFVLIPIFGAIYYLIPGLLIGIFVGIFTGFTLPPLAWHVLAKYPDRRISRLMIYALFILLNMSFSMIIWGGAYIFSGIGRDTFLVVVTNWFYAGVIPMLISIIPALYFASPFVAQAEVMEAAINYRNLSANMLSLDQN